MSAVLRYAEWTIGPERDKDGHLVVPTRLVQCTTCPEASPPGAQQSDTDMWAMKHADRTNHRSFQEITTAPLTAHPAPTNPLAEAERDTR
ncbi:hypothetical protein GCM10018793_44290 [Streptomyces sulfonofaciens]|uniref:DUF7848 domain-containing protein n=1 Tax=Streptomyces sulfonofaciens TaxID=68272 RepID=A0A919L3X9_9ACTN|nr:hypothetical protein [Streptomyces sulfonofaciens]GHH83083.1 hypothetical protein GCM10018793_44290 [Streptomyces sulfonofaciens]